MAYHESDSGCYAKNFANSLHLIDSAKMLTY